MSNAVFDRAVDQMLLALGSRPEPERTLSFVQAVERENLCLSCGAKAAEQLSGMLKRRPFPADLVEATKDVQNNTTEHATHISDRKALGPGELHNWWVTQAPAIVRRVWPELSAEQTIGVAAKLESLAYVKPDVASITEELGFVDEMGPSPERQWWLETYPEFAPVTLDPAIPVGDR